MKAVVLLSGGLDSSTCLAMAVREYGAKNVLAVSAYYGQKHDRELTSAKKVSEYYAVKHEIIDLQKIFVGSTCSLLKESEAEIPETTYKEQVNAGTVSTYVPFRNGIFLACATAFALENECQAIYYGAHADDAAGDVYPDCSEAFADAMNQAIYFGSGKKVSVCAPFIGKPKSEIVKIGLQIGVPYELTWSCYEGGEKPCGKCATCRDRAEAFKKNGKDDPLL